MSTIVEKLAKQIYKRETVIFAWDDEQDHVRYNYLERAQHSLNAIQDAGLVVVEANEVASLKEEIVRLEIAKQRSDKRRSKQNEKMAKKEKAEADDGSGTDTDE